MWPSRPSWWKIFGRNVWSSSSSSSSKVDQENINDDLCEEELILYQKAAAAAPTSVGFVAKGPSRESFEYSNASSSFAPPLCSSWSTFHLIWTTREKKHKPPPGNDFAYFFFFVLKKCQLSYHINRARGVCRLPPSNLCCFLSIGNWKWAMSSYCFFKPYLSGSLPFVWIG